MCQIVRSESLDLPLVLQVVVIDQFDARCSPSVRLNKASNIGIKHNVLRVRDIISGPSRNTRVSILESVGRQIMNKGCPRAAHKGAQISIAGTLVCKRVDSVSKTFKVVEYEGDFLEMSHLNGPGDAGGNGIEAVTVGRDVCGGPGFTGQTSVGNENVVSCVGR